MRDLKEGDRFAVVGVAAEGLSHGEAILAAAGRKLRDSFLRDAGEDCDIVLVAVPGGARRDAIRRITAALSVDLDDTGGRRVDVPGEEASDR